MNMTSMNFPSKTVAGPAAIIGDHPSTMALRSMVARVARSTASVMISGPSGAGKEVAARAIHDASDRADKPFVAINCGSIPAELIESELFGHERGSFTGAHSRRIGRFEEAHGGTLFLDEIGDMRFDMQVKLLRVLEDRLITRVGGTGTIPVDVRIICATHQDLERSIEEGRFREDLFFRLSVVPIDIPGLAERASDIPQLIRHFQGRSPLGSRAGFSQSAVAMLQGHDWPGNIRELRNVIERAGVFYAGQEVGAVEIADLLNAGRRRSAPALPQFDFETTERETTPAALPATFSPDRLRGNDGQPINLKDFIEAVELEQIRHALESADGVISEAARLLTLKRTTLIEKIRKYGVMKSC